MLVYGDHNEIADTNELPATLGERIDCVARLAPGLSRHAALVGILVEAGQLLQGLADADFAEQGEDSGSPITDAAGRFVLQLAKAVRRSWDSGFECLGELPVAPELNQLRINIRILTETGE